MPYKGRSKHSRCKQDHFVVSFSVYISESNYLTTIATSLISYYMYLDFFHRDLVKCILENISNSDS